MSPGLLHSLLSNFWSIFLIVFFFGSSILVHELGHFLAARRRGLAVQRFSIGLGPAIPGCSWTGKDGVEYRLAWFPVGGYVLLPQFADLSLLEGEAAVDATHLPPVSYLSKMIVLVAGAVFNVIFAFILACIIWVAGESLPNDMTGAARIGYVKPTLDLADGSTITSPAVEAGLQVGDTVRAVDGEAIPDWTTLYQRIFSGSGRDAQGRPQAVFTIERDGRTFDVTLHPRISTEDKVRQVGISSWYDLIVSQFNATDSLGEKLGFRTGDQILTFDGHPMANATEYQDYLIANRSRVVNALIKRGAATVAIAIPPRPDAVTAAHLGLVLTTGYTTVHPSPFGQIRDQITTTFRSLSTLLNPHSDVGLSKMSGPIGIVHYFSSAASAGLLAVINLTIMINVGLACLNLLPIPVLDGGHMLFATIGRLRGRSLPTNFIVNTQVVFSVLLLSMVLYISVFDVRRWARDWPSEHPAAAAPVQPSRDQPTGDRH